MNEYVDYHSDAEQPDLSGEEMYSLTVQMVSENLYHIKEEEI